MKKDARLVVAFPSERLKALHELMETKVAGSMTGLVNLTMKAILEGLADSKNLEPGEKLDPECLTDDIYFFLSGKEIFSKYTAPKKKVVVKKKKLTAKQKKAAWEMVEKGISPEQAVALVTGTAEPQDIG